MELYGYTYNAANRLKTVTFQGNLVGTYTYVLVARLRQDGHHQLIQRVVTNSGAARAGCLWASEGATKDDTIHYIHDRAGNIIAEATSLGATEREYLWLPEAECHRATNTPRLWASKIP